MKFYMKVVHNVNTFYTKFGGHATSFKDTGGNSILKLDLWMRISFNQNQPTVHRNKFGRHAIDESLIHMHAHAHTHTHTAMILYCLDFFLF